jgi:hypothetical protein
MPTRPARRIHSGGQVSREQNERDDHQTDERTDYKTQDNGKLILVLAEPFQKSPQSGGKT